MEIHHQKQDGSDWDQDFHLKGYPLTYQVTKLFLGKVLDWHMFTHHKLEHIHAYWQGKIVFIWRYESFTNEFFLKLLK